MVQGLPPWFEHLLPAVTPSEPPGTGASSEEIFLSLLNGLAFWLLPLARSFLVLVFLALLKALTLPWRATTPLGRFCSLPLLGVQPKVLQPLGHAMCHGRVASWQPWMDRKGRFGRHVSRTAGTRRTSCLWSLILGCLSIPRSPSPHVFVGLQAVWVMQANTCAVYGAEAPEDLPLPHDTDAPAASPPASTGPQAPRSPEAHRLPDVIHEGIATLASDYIGVAGSPPRGPPPPVPVQVMVVDNAVQHTRPVVFRECNVSVWISAPSFVPETLQFPLQLPCDIEDAVDAVERHVQALRLPYCNRAIPVRPQPFPSCAAMILAPDWSTFSALSVVCLDLRDLREHADGPVFTSFLTRPTCLAELCREASIHDHSRCRVYTGTDTEPLREDEEIHLASGCLVTFMRTDRMPCFANDLQYRLQFPDVWQAPPRFPAGPPVRSSLLLLHASGRYLYRPQASHDPGDVAAARFIGIDRATVDFHTPKPGCIEHIMYRGIRVRGVIAVADRIYEGQCVIFLDLRQVAEGVQFVVLEVPYVMLDALPALLRSRPPPGWELKVTGGRRRRDRIQVENSDTLVFGYQYICTSEPEEPPHDPTTDDSDDEGEESEDSDQAPPTSQSDATTRSRSRRRRSPRERSVPSSDHSYHGDLDAFTAWFRKAQRPWLTISLPDFVRPLLLCTAGLFSSTRAFVHWRCSACVF